MKQESWLAKNALLIAGMAALLGLAVLMAWRLWPQNKVGSELPAGVERSPAGWEIRYNAAIALARRGSDKAGQRLDILKEMLDEQQQRVNFAKRDANPPVVDEAGASSTVLNALKAIAHLHKENPKLDLSELKESINKLTQSSNPALRAEAEQTRIKLSQTN